MDHMSFEALAPVLETVAVDQAAGKEFDVASFVEEREWKEWDVKMTLEAARGAGLVFDDGIPMEVTRAGEQYLRIEGNVERDALVFLPRTIGDLYARVALLAAGTVMVDEFRYQVLTDTGQDWVAQEIVPLAFESAVDELLAMNLFAAAVALMARLSADEPAGCLAEELVAVHLISQAEGQLEMDNQRGIMTDKELTIAKAELNCLFDLFGDDDVRDLFKYSEPSDAAVAGHSPEHHQLGVVDQRIEAWFKPFGGVIGTGYLDERPDRFLRWANEPNP